MNLLGPYLFHRQGAWISHQNLFADLLSCTSTNNTLTCLPQITVAAKIITYFLSFSKCFWFKYYKYSPRNSLLVHSRDSLDLCKLLNCLPLLKPPDRELTDFKHDIAIAWCHQSRKHPASTRWLSTPSCLKFTFSITFLTPNFDRKL